MQARTAVGRLSGLRLVFRTEWSATEGVYGLILALSVIAVAREYDSSPDAGLVGLSVLSRPSSSTWRTSTPTCSAGASRRARS